MPSDTLHKQIATRIRDLARKRKKSLNVVAELAGISRAHLGRLLKCEQSPTVETLAKVAAALDIEVTDLVKR